MANLFDVFPTFFACLVLNQCLNFRPDKASELPCGRISDPRLPKAEDIFQQVTLRLCYMTFNMHIKMDEHMTTSLTNLCFESSLATGLTDHLFYSGCCANCLELRRTPTAVRYLGTRIASTGPSNQ